jgi:hypothetical protein
MVGMAGHIPVYTIYYIKLRLSGKLWLKKTEKLITMNDYSRSLPIIYTYLS